MRGIVNPTLLLLAAWLTSANAADSPAEPQPFPAPCTMRVESELFVASAEAAVARSLTLFHEGVAWDFLEQPAAEGTMQVTEIVLHDPARERIVVIDPVRAVKT